MRSKAVFYLIFFLKYHPILSSDDEFRLIQDLKNNYDAMERPVWNHSEAIRVNLRIFLQQLVDVDEKNQVLTMVVWTQSTWNDYKMKWDPKEYGNITNIQLANNLLWKPDILLFNSSIRCSKFAPFVAASSQMLLEIIHDGQQLVFTYFVPRFNCDHRNRVQSAVGCSTQLIFQDCPYCEVRPIQIRRD
uniref:Neur_chan_LBD domain-containing protein n=1 Tax=Heterorhabditis bacteriophora TaxID=37862 RepID=A0A1I7WKB8_HETBA